MSNVDVAIGVIKNRINRLRLQAGAMERPIEEGRFADDARLLRSKAHELEYVIKLIEDKMAGDDHR